MTKIHHYGVVVGIDRYPGLSNLEYARADARAFAQWLRDADGGDLPPENVVELIVPDDALPQPLDTSAARPVADMVFDAVKAVRKRADAAIKAAPSAWEDTRFYFYVAGHGIAPTARDAALLMANAEDGDFGRNVSCDELLLFLRETPSFKEVVLFADCCREYVGNAPIGKPTWDRDRRDRGKIRTTAGYATFFGDYALEPTGVEASVPPDERRGYFTKAVLEGLRKEAADEDGRIDAVLLAGYVRKRVEDLTRTFNPAQVPEMVVDAGDPIVFRPARPRAPAEPAPAHSVTIHFPAGATGGAVLTDGVHAEVARHTIAAEPWRLTLRNQLYKIAPADRDAFAVRYFEVRGEAVDVHL